MKAFRWTWHAKKSCTDELVEAIKSWPEYGLPKPPHSWRVYWHSALSPWDVVVWEVEFADMAEYQAWIDEFYASPRVGEFYERRRGLTDRGGGGDVWNVEQFG